MNYNPPNSNWSSSLPYRSNLPKCECKSIMTPISAYLGYFQITNNYVQSDYISHRIESNPTKKRSCRRKLCSNMEIGIFYFSKIIELVSWRYYDSITRSSFYT
ncbi:MAG TPA: hypothetical protein VL854_07820, partial [Nitrososphaeraceae archaeon]|nr:hypothetical protein [Nitrososphaeraceae archaeon]